MMPFEAAIFYFLFVCLCSCIASTVGNFDLTKTRPPHILENVRLKKINYFKKKVEGETVELPCSAKGLPEPSYKWKKNGEMFDPTLPELRNRIAILPGSGFLTFSEPVESDQGEYQCVATNKIGTSFSDKVNLKPAELGSFGNAEVIEKSVVLGNKLVLECKPPMSTPKAHLTWVKTPVQYQEDSTDEPVEFSERIAMDYEGNLHFSSVNITDQAVGMKYVCKVENKFLRLSAVGADATIKTIGQMVNKSPVDISYNSPREQLGLVKSTVKFLCIFSGSPTPIIKWRRVDGELDNTRMSVLQHGHELKIRNVKYADQGTYECEGTNELPGVKTIRFTLTVESKPMWEIGPKFVDAGVEEDATFMCKAKGKPKPVVEWFINGQPIGDAPANVRRTFADDQLSYKNLTRDDADVIQCNATNTHGSLWADFYLSVEASKPEFITPPGKVKVATGRDVTLTCVTSGKPVPKVYWKKGVQKIEGSRYRILPNGNLIIEEATQKDAGDYSCHASNRFGDAEAGGKLIVRRKTEILEAPSDQEVTYGQEARFRCQAITDAAENAWLIITWRKDGHLVDLSDPNIEQLPDNSLVLRKTKSTDSGRYSCVADNQLDNATEEADLTVKAPPDPPHSVDLRSCEARRAHLIWEEGPSNYMPISHFIVEAQTTSDREWKESKETGDTQPEVTVTLSPWANYTFRVLAVNALGRSDPSIPTKTICTTPADRPDQNPGNVRTVEDKTHFLVVEWKEMTPIEHNGPNFKYIIEVEKVGSGKKQTYEIDDHTVTKKEIPVDTIYEQYQIHVRAQNAQGNALMPARTVKGYSGEAKPDVVPKNFERDLDVDLTPTSAGFMWDPVDTSASAMNGAFKGYKIRFWKTEDPENTRKEIMIPHVEEKRRKRKRQTEKVKGRVHNLPPFSDIELEVVAVNTYFSSNGSNIINMTTPQGVPGPVRGLTALVRGAHHFLLQWEEPEEHNGILLGYDVGYRQVEGLEIGDLEIGEMYNIREEGPQRANLEGLEDNTEYRVYVWGKTSQGRGEPYFIDVKTTPPGPSEAPEIPTLVLGLITENSINVTWTVGRSNRAGSSHFVEYRKTGEAKWQSTPDDKINHWINVSNLEPATSYEVRVVAKSKGELVPSEMKTAQTAGAAAATESTVLSAWWFIVLMVVIAVLLLVLIIVCFIKRSRGDKYHVQEKERLRGNDPEALDHDHFNEYAKNGETDPLAKNPDSFEADLDKAAPGSESDSLAEYGDVDPSKFNEDGSFIGQYGADGKPGSDQAQPSAMSTFV